ncbi:MAG: hypothetical protein Q9182_002734 [Xanthomendoza sp. 2 TL-2023]
MNTIRSTWYGWGTLIIAGGGAYFFAKRSINADKAARHEADMKRRRLSQSIDESSTPKPASKQRHRRSDHAASPSTEASHDPAPISHTSENGKTRLEEESKFEAPVPYRTRKGDRLG